VAGAANVAAMNAPVITFSEDQAEAWDNVAIALRQAGVDLDDHLL